MEKEKSCGCIVINEEKEILLVHQTSGHWGMPKGHVEEGETEQETAIRETKEETNIDVIIKNDYRYTMEYIVKENVLKEVVFFVAESKNKDIIAQQGEVTEIKWLKIDDAINTVTYQNTKDLLNQVKKDIFK